MNIMNDMERTLQEGTPKASQVPANTKDSSWPREFREPVDAALHLGTSKASVGPFRPLPEGHGPQVIE